MLCAAARPLIARALREPLALPDAEALRLHLERCPGCRAEQAQFEQVDRLLRASTAVQQAATSSVSVDTAALYRQARVAAPPPSRPWLPVLACGAVCVTAAAGLQQSQRPPAAVPAPAPMARRPAEPARPSGPPSPRMAAGGPLSAGRWPAPATSKSAGRPKLAVAPREAPSLTRMASARPALEAPARGLPPVRQVEASLPEIIEQQVARRNVALVPMPAQNVARVETTLVQQVARQVTPAPPGAVFRGDTRLDGRLALAERDRPLGELLAALGRKLNVPLAASADTADDRATLFFKARPAAEALALVARHLDFQWRRSKEGYELYQDAGGRSREEGRRRTDLAVVETQFRLANRLGMLTPPQRQARMAELAAKLKAEGLSASDRSRLGAEKQILLDVMLGPAVVDAAFSLFGSLNPVQVGQLLAGDDLRFSTAGGTLAPAFAEKVRAATAILESVNGPLPQIQADATLRLSDEPEDEAGPPSPRGRQLQLRFRCVSLRGERKQPRIWSSGWSPQLPAPERPARPVGEDADPLLKTEVDLTLPGPERQLPPILGGSLTGQAAIGGVWQVRATVGDIAKAIHAAAGLDVVADSFVGARVDPSRLRGRRTLRSVLDTVAEELDYDWRLSGGVLFLRSRHAHHDRPAEAPERILRPFRERVVRAGSLSLDDLASLSAALSNPQARSMARFWGWYLEDTGILPTEDFYGYRHHLRLWASLTPAQQQAARSDAGLAVGLMSPAQRDLWTAGLLTPPESASTVPVDQSTLTPEALANASFRLTTHQVQQLLYVHTSEDGTKRFGSGISVEGPPTEDPRKYQRFPPGMPEPQPAGPQVSLTSYRFTYRLGAEGKPARQQDVYVLPLRRLLPKAPVEEKVIGSGARSE